MKQLILVFAALIGLSIAPVFANDFGNADFPGEIEVNAPKSYHDAWCRQLKKNCRVRFNGRSMQVEGFKGIKREQFLGFRTEIDGRERYFYVNYMNSRNKKTTALFLFTHRKAAREFGLALARWYEQDPKPYPNYRYPNSQGPQDSHGRDKGLNPFDK